jgi:hypothetical protein
MRLPASEKLEIIVSRRAGRRAQCGSSLQPRGASGLPAGCCGQASRTTRGGVGFLSHLRSLRATMSQKFSVPQAVSFVSQVLKRDKQGFGHGQ